GCDAAILAAASAGQLELNVMMPVMAWHALRASTILAKPVKPLDTRCVNGIQADEARCRELLDRSTAVATALSPYIGYAATAEIAKTAVQEGRSIAAIVRERKLIPEDKLAQILSPEEMTSPGIPGSRTTATCSAAARLPSSPASCSPVQRRSRRPSTRACFRQPDSESSKGPIATR